MIRTDKNRILMKVEDKSLKIGMLLFAKSRDSVEDLIFKKLCKYFEEGKVLIGFKNGHFFTKPPITDLIEKEIEK